MMFTSFLHSFIYSFSPQVLTENQLSKWLGIMIATWNVLVNKVVITWTHHVQHY